MKGHHDHHKCECDRDRYYALRIILLIYIIRLIEILFPELSNPPPPASAVISGSVTNSNAAPDNTVAGVTITATPDGSTTPAASTTTDASGNFTLPSLANGTYTVTAFLANADGSSLGASEEVTIAGVDVVAPALALVRS